MKLFGLLGHPLSHSFSKGFFNNKFSAEGISATYQNFDLEDIEHFPNLISEYCELNGLNVTIPYKQAVIPYLDQLDETASHIGAVNVVKFIRDGNKTVLKGYNSDVVGFSDSISSMLSVTHNKALVLGTGGASKAVIYALNKLGLQTTLVSRVGVGEVLSYSDITPEKLQEFNVIVNTTPLGMYPNIDTAPDLPYEAIDGSFVCYDLVYNPEETKFLRLCKERGAKIKNGHEMLILQALESWRIWNA